MPNEFVRLPEPPKEFAPVLEFPAETIPPLRDRPSFETPPEISNRKEVVVKLQEPALSVAAAAKLLTTAAESSAIKTLLGERFESIGARISPTKDGEETVALFYSYDNQIAVHTRLIGKEFIGEALNFQPALTDREQERVAQLARKALEGAVDGLEVGLMSIQREEPEDPLVGRRLADVRFFVADERLARYFVIVDVADDKVLDAGPVGTEVP